MPFAEYLRQQAATCLRLSRASFDLTTAERLRVLAAELRAKAGDIEDDEVLQAHMMQGNNFSASESDTGTADTPPLKFG